MLYSRIITRGIYIVPAVMLTLFTTLSCLVLPTYQWICPQIVHIPSRVDTIYTYIYIFTAH